MAIKSFGFSSAGGGAGTDNLDDVTSRGATTTNAITVGGVTVGTEYSLPTLDGSANQVLQTNGTGTVSFATLDFTGGLEYKGTFNATAGTPSLANAEQGDYYKIDTEGTIYGKTWAVNDSLLINADMGGTITNSKIDKIDNTDTPASETVAGVIEIATNAEAEAGTATDKTLVPSNISSIALSSFNDDLSYLSSGDNVSLLTNDANYVASGDNVSVLTNDAGYLTDITGESIGDLSDVTVTTPSNGQVLSYNGTAWVNSASSAGSLSGLSDTTIGTPTNGEVLKYNGAAWVDANVDYTEVTNTPTNVSTFTNDANYVASGDNVSVLTNDAGYLTSIPTASHSTAGILETATNAEATNATANDKIITPANLSHIDLSTFDNDSGFISDITSESLGDLSDVTVTTPSNGQVLSYNGTNWVNSASSAGSLSGLSDTTISTPVNGEVLKYNGTAWVDAQLAYSELSGTPTNVSTFTNDAGYLTDITSEGLNDLSDVSFTAGAGINGHVLTYDNTAGEWQAVAPASGGGSDFTAITADVARTDFAVTNYYTVLEESTQHSIYLPNYFEGDTLGDFQNKRITVDNQGETTVRVLLRTSGTISNRLYNSYEDFGSSNFNDNQVVISSITYAYIDIPAFTTYKLTCREHATVSYWFVEPFIMQFDNFSPQDRDILVYNSTTEKYENSSDRSELIYSFQNSNFTAEVGYYYYVDSSAGNITVSLSRDLTVVGKRFKIFKAKSANSVIITESNTTNSIDPDDGAAGQNSRSIQARSMIEFIAYSTSADYTYIITPQVEINDSDLNASGEFLIYDASVGAKQLITAPYTMPSSDGSANQILSTDGAGSLSFIDQPSGTQPTLTSASPSANYTISTHDGIEEIYILTPTANVSVFLPSASSCGSGYKYHIKNMASGFTLTIDANSTETIDGSTTASIANQYEALTLVTDGSNWFII